MTLWSVACQVPLSMGLSRQEYWSELPFPSQENLPKPETEPESPALASRFFTEPWAVHHMLIIDNLPNPDLSIIVVGHVTPYKIKKECFLLRSCLDIIFYGWAGIPTEGEVWSMYEWVKLLSRVWLFATPWSIAHQPPLSMGFSRQEYWSGLTFPSSRGSS